MEKLNFEIGDYIKPNLAMRFAIELAEMGSGFVSPNPPVGCVIVDKNNKIIGAGYHELYGQEHAEVNAVKSVTDKNAIIGSTVYVTLEPCGHFGKTPPCSQLLLDSKVGKVIYAVSDPNPKFNHEGIKNLASNGIIIEKNNFGYQKLLRALLDKYLHPYKSQEPYITLKCATSLDGFIALKNGESKWLSNEMSRHHAHLLRHEHDAIIIGVNTFLEDNPSLNIRLEDFNSENSPKVIIIDPNLRSLEFFKTSNIKKLHLKENIFFASIEENEKVNCIKIEKNTDGIINLNKFMNQLSSLNIKSILVEGGGATISNFISQKMFHCFKNFITPAIIGSRAGVSWTSQHFTQDLKTKTVLEDSSIKQLEQDMLYTSFSSKA